MGEEETGGEGRGKEGTGREGMERREERGGEGEVEEGGRCPPNADSWIRSCNGRPIESRV